MKPWSMVLSAGLSASPAFALPVELTVDNQLQLDGRPWPVGLARIQLGEDGWTVSSLQAGDGNRITLDGPARPRETVAMLELRHPDGGRWLGSVWLGADARVVLQGAIQSGSPLPPLRSWQGGPASLPTLHSASHQGLLAPAAAEAYEWPAECLNFATPQLFSYVLCRVGYPGSTVMYLSMFGAGPLPGLVFPTGYLGTMTSSSSPQRWIKASASCTMDPWAVSACSTFQGWVTPIYLSLDMQSALDPAVSASLTGWGLGLSINYLFGYVKASP